MELCLLHHFVLVWYQFQQGLKNQLRLPNAGPTIPFPNFSKLFKTWLEVLATIDVRNREDMFSNYFKQILISPDKIILFNLDAIFEIFLQVDNQKKQVLIASIKAVFDRLDIEGESNWNYRTSTRINQGSSWKIR